MENRWGLFPRAAAKGFTLIELLAAMAIVALLAAIAIPAYNSYTTKAQFSEVVLATSPTKTAIDTCATDGECVVNNSISLAGGTTVLVGAALDWAYQMAYGYAYYNYGSLTPYAAAAQSQAFATQEEGWGNLVGPAPFNPPNYYCLIQSGLCAQPAFAAASLTQYMGLYTGAGAGVQTLPCIGMAPCTPATKYVQSVSYDLSGNITATATSNGSLNGETYVLLPQYSGGHVDWVVSGSCKTRAGGVLC
jgi:type IV pilus assembly protein PilA